MFQHVGHIMLHFFKILINSEPYLLFHYIIIKDYVKVIYKEFCYFNETFSSLYGIRKVVTHFTYAKCILRFFFLREYVCVHVMASKNCIFKVFLNSLITPDQK